MKEYVFYFRDRHALDHQRSRVAEDLYNQFWDTTRASTEADIPLGLSPKVLSVDKLYDVCFRPRYGAAILVRPIDSIEAVIKVVGLDGWEYGIHSSDGDGRERVAIANPKKAAVMELGHFWHDKTARVYQVLDSILEKSESKNKGYKRRGASGNQKTPSFLAEKLCQAMSTVAKEGEEGNVAIRNEAINPLFHGGTTDVGLHTGSRRRNTSFPLVASVVFVILSSSGVNGFEDVYDKLMTVFYFDFLQDIPVPKTYDALKIDEFVTIMRAMEPHLLDSKDAEFKEYFVSYMETVRKQLENTPYGRPPPKLTPSPVEELMESLEAPAFPMAPCKGDQVDTSSLAYHERVREEAKKNLNWCNVCATSFNGKSQDAWVQLHQLNEFFWKKSEHLNADRSLASSMSVVKHELRRLSAVVNVATREGKGKSPRVMTVLIRSYLFLANSIALCLAHKVAEQEFTWFGECRPALDPDDLKHLVLDDWRAFLAMEQVRHFLTARQARNLVPFREPQDTLKVALVYGNQSSRDFSDIYETAKADAEEEISKRWNKIQQTKITLAQLDADLVAAQHDLSIRSSAVSRFETTNRTWNSVRRKWTHTDEHYRVIAARDSAQSRVLSLERDIRICEYTPESLYFPLPRQRDCAYQWLFFIFMPQTFQDVAQLAHATESCLWDSAPKSSIPKSNLCDWYARHRRLLEQPWSLDFMTLGSQHAHRPDSSPNIRHYSREDCVYFPDIFPLLPAWVGRDPFGQRPEDITISCYTEKLKRADKSDFMQQFVAMQAYDSRENVAIAAREKRPCWLSPEQYIAFANLRAAPRSQIRCLLDVFCDNLLPFGHDCVHTLIVQLLFNVGGEDWYTDIHRDVAGMACIVALMTDQLGMLRESPKNYNHLLLVGSISSFLGQRPAGDAAWLIASEAADVFSDWADQASRSCGGGVISKQSYRNQAIYYACAILCLAFCPKKDSLRLVRLIVKFRNCWAYVASDETTLALETAASRVLSTKIHDICCLILTDARFLDTCLLLVDETCPSNLQWKAVTYPESSETGCFEAKSDRLYSINVLNGTVLFDGSPKSLLPPRVSSDPLYKRTFGSANFEISCHGFGSYSTSLLIKERFSYLFEMNSNDALDIFELDKPTGIKMQLLPIEKLDLPAHYVEPYSHWYHEKSRALLFRPAYFEKRNVHYVMANGYMYQVPSNYQSQNADDLCRQLLSFDRIWLGQTPFMNRLRDSGFECPDFILMTTNCENSKITYSLPRYDLKFVECEKLILSDEFNGFWVSQEQHLPDTLAGITSYVILENDAGNRLVLLPDGDVSSSGATKIGKAWDDKVDYHAYKVHPRFGHLLSPDTLSRLHLACLYVANSCQLPDRQTGKPGAEVAVQLARKCMQNEALSDEEEEKLVNLCKLSTHSCTLRIMVHFIYKSSLSLRLPYARNLISHPSLCLDRLAHDEYVLRNRRRNYAPLTCAEEMYIFGCTTRDDASYLNGGNLVAKSSAVQREVEKIEQELAITNAKTGSPHTLNAQFPLRVQSMKTPIAKQVIEDLHNSYKSFRKLPRPSCGMEIGVNKSVFEKVGHMRRKEELVLHESLNCRRGIAQRLAYACGYTNNIVPYDYLTFVCQGDGLHSFAHIGDSTEMGKVYRSALDWCLLCVLEDKLSRINSALQRGSIPDISTERGCRRTWHAASYPRWLAFEVEEQLQIRPNQYQIVDQLLQSLRQSATGTALQLNMGLGKTRVLIPMLVMELAMKRFEKCRVNLLSSIFNEAAKYYRQTLSASVQQIKLFTLPFHRDHPLDATSAKILTDEMRKCWDFRGCILVTPQDRNSLLLKQEEEECQRLESFESIVDIIDESDAILDYNFQLVYAIGDQVELPDCIARATAVEALISLLVKQSHGKTVYERFTEPNFSGVLSHQACRAGSFPKLRLVRDWFVHQDSLAHHLAAKLVERPPYEFRWMKEVRNLEDRQLLISLLADSATDAYTEVAGKHLFKEFSTDIWAIRGYLAYGVLFYGLSQRCNVHYGLRTGNRTRLAVPYAASDTPKERAEFSQPDMAIVYTYLSYLDAGLSREALREALATLEKKGLTLQKEVYSSWIAGVRPAASEADLRKFDDVGKIDITNESLFEVMYKNLHCCMEVIFFWLKEVVIPVDTAQIPRRRATSAWNLVASKKVLGFSGTDDNRFLLPTFVSQQPHHDAELQSTNGRMIDVILASTKLPPHVIDKAPVLWEAVVTCCFNLGVQALIDVSGLMAGSKTDEVLKFILGLIDQNQFTWKGVVFFDSRERNWIVHEVSSQRRLPLEKSAIHEAESFVYYDQSRCRGTDMKLPDDAIGLVTLEAKLTKDRFLQGCARMRKLGPNRQHIVLAGTKEVISSSSTTASILSAILQNTIEATENGLVTYHDRGRDFFNFPEPITDLIDLEPLYSRGTTNFQDCRHYLDSTYERAAVVSGDQLLFVERCKSLGESVKVGQSRLGQECEKEIEAETHQEEHAEVEYVQCNPRKQTDWAFRAVFERPQPLFGTIFLPLDEVIKKAFPKLIGVKWSKDLYCTENFWKTTTDAELRSNMSLFARKVGAFLVFRDKRAVLISSYELDKILPFWWAQGKSSRIRCGIEHLSLWTKGLRLSGATLPITPSVAASLKLFRGYVAFSDEETKILETMLWHLSDPRRTLEELLMMRHRLSHFERSDLEDVAYRVGTKRNLSERR